MAKCQGIKVNGEQCTRSATQGEYCKTHSIAKDLSPARPPGKLELEFKSIAERCMDELEKCKTEGVRVQWMKMILDCCRYAKEEQRLLEGTGANVGYVFNVVQPEPAPIPEGLEEQEEPLSASEGQGETVH